MKKMMMIMIMMMNGVGYDDCAATNDNSPI